MPKGQMDVPLSEEGRKQVWLLGKALQHHRFSKIFASDLQRASEVNMQIPHCSQGLDINAGQ